MKRGTFIFSALAFAPMSLFAKVKMKLHSAAQKGFKINAGEGRIHGHLKLKGVNSNILDLKVSGKDTEGALAIFEQTSLSQGKGTPLHVHHFQDEVFHIEEGSYYFQVGEEKFTLSKGDCIFLPREIAHAWTQISETGKMTVVLQPAGKLEDFFVAVAALDHEPTQQEMETLFMNHDMQVVGPPLKLEK